MTKKAIGALILLGLTAPAIAMAEECTPSRWTVTLDHLRPLSDENRQLVLDVLNIGLSLELLEQAIAEGQIPLEAFGGE